MRVETKGKRSAAASGLPDLPFGITSFGAALLGQKIYVCEGQLGPAHEYSIEGQSDRLLRLDLEAPRQWDVVGTVPHRAGLAMVSYDGKAYRIGGFEARNKKGEPADLHSARDFSRFDPATGRWEELPPLPQGRSSHDAVLVGSRLIVVGGWDLRGTEKSIWHDSALEIDLSSAHPEWKSWPARRFIAAPSRSANLMARFMFWAEWTRRVNRARRPTCSTWRAENGRLDPSCPAKGSKASAEQP
jgi:hypothetical protein